MVYTNSATVILQEIHAIYESQKWENKAKTVKSERIRNTQKN